MAAACRNENGQYVAYRREISQWRESVMKIIENIVIERNENNQSMKWRNGETAIISK
jgi:hypothetical protein